MSEASPAQRALAYLALAASMAIVGGYVGFSKALVIVFPVFLLAAVTCEALYVVIGKKLTASLGPKRISALINLWGLVLVAPLALWQLVDFSPRYIDGSYWALLFVYAIAASVVTVWLWMTGMRHVPAASAGIFTVFLPVSAAAVGVAFYGERFTATQIAAFALALGGVMLATWPVRRQN